MILHDNDKLQILGRMGITFKRDFGLLKARLIGGPTCEEARKRLGVRFDRIDGVFEFEFLNRNGYKMDWLKRIKK